jgi:hypothetical protein
MSLKQTIRRGGSAKTLAAVSLIVLACADQRPFIAAAQSPQDASGAPAASDEIVTLDAELVGRILAGEQKLAAAIRACSGEITRRRSPFRRDTNQAKTAPEAIQRVRFGIRDGSTRAEFLTNTPDQISQVLLATPSGSYQLLPFDIGNGIDGVLTAFEDPAAEEVAVTLESDVIGLVGALLAAPGPKGSDYLATTRGTVSKVATAEVPFGIAIKSSFQGDQTDTSAPPSDTQAAAADFEMVLDTEHDYAVRFFRSKTVLPGVVQEIERTISLTAGRDGSFVPNVVTTRFRMTPDTPSAESSGFDETVAIDFDDRPPSADTFTRAWIEKLAGTARVDVVDRNGNPDRSPLPVLPSEGPDPDRRPIEGRPSVSPWLLVNIGAVLALAAVCFARWRTARQ